MCNWKSLKCEIAKLLLYTNMIRLRIVRRPIYHNVVGNFGHFTSTLTYILCFGLRIFNTWAFALVFNKPIYENHNTIYGRAILATRVKVWTVSFTQTTIVALRANSFWQRITNSVCTAWYSRDPSTNVVSLSEYLKYSNINIWNVYVCAGCVCMYTTKQCRSIAFCCGLVCVQNAYAVLSTNRWNEICLHKSEQIKKSP